MHTTRGLQFTTILMGCRIQVGNKTSKRYFTHLKHDGHREEDNMAEILKKCDKPDEKWTRISMEPDEETNQYYRSQCAPGIFNLNQKVQS